MYIAHYMQPDKINADFEVPMCRPQIMKNSDITRTAFTIVSLKTRAIAKQNLTQWRVIAGETESECHGLNTSVRISQKPSTWMVPLVGSLVPRMECFATVEPAPVTADRPCCGPKQFFFLRQEMEYVVQNVKSIGVFTTSVTPNRVL